MNALVASGELTYDHPDYQRFVKLMVSFHGRGQFEFLEHPGTARERHTEPGEVEECGESAQQDEGS